MPRLMMMPVTPAPSAVRMIVRHFRGPADHKLHQKPGVTIHLSSLLCGMRITLKTPCGVFVCRMDWNTRSSLRRILSRRTAFHAFAAALGTHRRASHSRGASWNISALRANVLLPAFFAFLFQRCLFTWRTAACNHKIVLFFLFFHQFGKFCFRRSESALPSARATS